MHPARERKEGKQVDEQFEQLGDTPAFHETGILPLLESEPGVTKPARISRRKQPVTTMTLTSRTCRWPFGDPAEPDFHYCGQLPQTSGPYCDTHEAMSRPSGQHKKQLRAPWPATPIGGEA